MLTGSVRMCAWRQTARRREIKGNVVMGLGLVSSVGTPIKPSLGWRYGDVSAIPLKGRWTADLRGPAELLLLQGTSTNTSRVSFRRLWKTLCPSRFVDSDDKYWWSRTSSYTQKCRLLPQSQRQCRFCLESAGSCRCSSQFHHWPSSRNSWHSLGFRLRWSNSSTTSHFGAECLPISIWHQQLPWGEDQQRSYFVSPAWSQSGDRRQTAGDFGCRLWPCLDVGRTPTTRKRDDGLPTISVQATPPTSGGSFQFQCFWRSLWCGASGGRVECERVSYAQEVVGSACGLSNAVCMARQW